MVHSKIVKRLIGFTKDDTLVEVGLDLEQRFLRTFQWVSTPNGCISLCNPSGLVRSFEFDPQTKCPGCQYIDSYKQEKP